MSRQASRLPAWPFVALVLGVALLSLVAPAGWRQTKLADHVSRRPAARGRFERHATPTHVQLQAEQGDEASPATGAMTAAFTPPSPAVESPPPAESPALESPTLESEVEVYEFVAARVESPAVETRQIETPAPNEPAPTEVAPVEVAPASDEASAAPESPTIPEYEPTEKPSPPRAELRTPARAQIEDESTLETFSDRTPAAESPVQRSWPVPVSLIEQLNGLIGSGVAPEWARMVLQDLARLKDVAEIQSPEVKPIFARLDAAAKAASTVADRLPEANDRPAVLRCGYAISRRIAVWTTLHELAENGARSAEWRPETMTLLGQTYRNVEMHLARTQHTQMWRQYLLLQHVPKLSVEGSPTISQRESARQMLLRLDTACLSEEQAAFLHQPVFQAWAAALRKYSAESIDPGELLNALERYEATFSVEESRRLAHGYQALRWSTDAGEARSAQPLNDHYRNANVRVAISASLINRILPSEHSSEEEVNDMIRDAHVRGTSQTSSRVRVFLVPDRLQWRLGLEAKGDVAAQTESQKGPATFFQDAWSNYNARKHVTVDKRGIRTERAQAAARSTSDLRGFETDYDGIPIFNLIARAIASRQYTVESRAAAAEVEDKVASMASQRLDEEIEKRLSSAEGEFQTRWLSPLRRMGLEPTPIDFETTDQRLIARYRLAGTHQLAAHTPRPQAPSNSWMSIQLHESAINNTFDQLGIGGRKMPIEDLYRELAAKFDRPAPAIPDDLPEGITLTLAADEAIRVRCDSGRLQLTLRVAELAQGRTKWKNFEVKATYVPSTDQREANLVRDGIIELGGERRGLGNQVALRAIFAKVLSKNRPIRLINHSLAKQPQLADLEVNQFVLNDGWLGVAMAPKANTARIPYRQPRRWH
ncbi:MAG: hypothetical protein U0939_16515 [Pirellulales bacterium]